jgi:hypothetical protein
VDVTADQHFAVTVGSRHRVVAASVAHQGERADPRGSLLAGLRESVASAGRRHDLASAAR